MLISHEVPNQMLDESTTFNDYGYCLAHLPAEFVLKHNIYKLTKAATQEEADRLNVLRVYAGYYLQYRSKTNKPLYLDNSAFELGKSINLWDLLQCINALNPTHYFVPDHCDSYKKSMKLHDRWFKEYNHQLRVTSPTGAKEYPKTIMALQGKNIKELINHYDNIKDTVDICGISYNYKFFGDELKLPTTRPQLVNDLLDARPLMQVHLLGCYTPAEFFTTGGKAIYNTPNVISLDTSLPVMVGLDGKRWGAAASYYKPKGKLCDNIHVTLKPDQYHAVKHNIKIFREIITCP